MKSANPARGYQGGYLVGFVIIFAVALRLLIFYRARAVVFLPMLGYSLLYVIEPWLLRRWPASRWLYFPLQVGLVMLLTRLRPFLDIQNLLFIPLAMQVVRTLSGRMAALWLAVFVALIGAALLAGMTWPEALAVLLLFLASAAFLISYDLLYVRTQAEEAESRRLLAALQVAHRQLQDYARQTETLAAARERNRLARELHDSVSQTIFSIRLTAQAARLLLEREPARVPALVERLQTMTSDALATLRSLIAALRP